MRLIKLTAFATLILSGLVFLSSCEREAEDKKTFLFQKSGIVLSGAQEVPANASPATGTMDVSYSKKTKLLTYKVKWSGLTDSVALMHIHGRAPVGFNAGFIHTIVGTSNSVFPQKTGTRFTFAKTGEISGTLLIDNQVVFEEDLLNGLYYMNIHTQPSFNGGEIRGQIKFQ